MRKLKASERYIEEESCLRIQKMTGDPNCTPKFGENGDPDRQVLIGDGLHYWLEFKAEEGRLRASQKERVRQLCRRGELVFFPRSVDEAVGMHIRAVSLLLARRGS